MDIREEKYWSDYTARVKTMNLIKQILDNHGYTYSRIYQRVNRGMIRVQFDFRKDLTDLSSEQRGMLVATKLLLTNYDIPAFIEITDEKGTPKILFAQDFEVLKSGEIVI